MTEFGLEDHHITRLRWFQEAAGSIRPWPRPINGRLLASRPKGIYKPKGSHYALSIRQSLAEEYPDGLPHGVGDGGWTYRYHREEPRNANPDTYWTNVALRANHRDGIPLGVMIQVEAEPESRYRILGLGLVSQVSGPVFVVSQYSQRI